jgi:hypothetical protein
MTAATASVVVAYTTNAGRRLGCGKARGGSAHARITRATKSSSASDAAGLVLSNLKASAN